MPANTANRRRQAFGQHHSVSLDYQQPPPAITRIRRLGRLSDTFHRPSRRTSLSHDQVDEMEDTIMRRTAEQKTFLNNTAHLTTKKAITDWVRSFVPYTDSMVEACTPLVNLICFEYHWPYAELWKYHPTQNALTLQTCFNRYTSVMGKWSALFENCLRDVEQHTSTMGLVSVRKDIVGRVFGSQPSVLVISDRVSKYCQPERSLYLQKAGIRTVICAPIMKNGSISHVLTFFSQNTAESRKHELVNMINLLSSLVGKYHGMTEQITDDDIPGEGCTE